jgi:hypothetical protein
MKGEQKEFEAAIDDIDSAEAEATVAALLKSLPGVWANGVVPGAIWVSFDPSVTACEDICEKLREAGFSPEITLVDGKPARC